MLLVLTTGVCSVVTANTILIADNRSAKVHIAIPLKATATQKYAAEELKKYLGRITGAEFIISSETVYPAIRIKHKDLSNSEAYRIEIAGKDLVLTAASDRALLYAVYDFLERLGCRWLAPDFDYYQSAAEAIPEVARLQFTLTAPVNEAPVFEYRKLDVAGSRTLESTKLKKLIEWMPKGRYNTIRFQMDKETLNPVKWDKYRADLTPEIKKRGIILEVGGHGYQHFLNSKMENGMLFKQHPDWFGKDSTCTPIPSDRLVFNTENPEAVRYFTDKIVKFVKDRPEIDIFDFWPPDVGRWQDCSEFRKYGTPQERQVRLANHVYTAVKKARPDIRMEIIAYSYALMPPEKTALNPEILLEICPINQSFEKQLYDTSAPAHPEYINSISSWRNAFKGNITLYSYYRKQAWRSAPNIIPHYMQNDMQWFADVPLQGIACYAESNDWYTYELNHYVLGRLGWNPNVNVDSLSSQLITARYGNNADVAASAYKLLEEAVRIYGSLPFSTLKTKEEIQSAQQKVDRQIAAITSAKEGNRDQIVSSNFSKLLLMYEYLQRDLEIQYLKASGASREQLHEKIRALVSFLEANLDEGVFILTGSDDFGRFTKKYGLTNQSLLD